MSRSTMSPCGRPSSPKTVSRVLNGDAAVREADRDIVREAIAALVRPLVGSPPRSVRNRSGLVGADHRRHLRRPAGQRPRRSARNRHRAAGVQMALADSGLTVLIPTTGGRQEKAPDIMAHLREHRVRGRAFVSSYHQVVARPPARACRLVLDQLADDNGRLSRRSCPTRPRLRTAPLTRRVIAAVTAASPTWSTQPMPWPPPPARPGLTVPALAEAAFSVPDPALVVEADVLVGMTPTPKRRSRAFGGP